jgi:curved DNA-binding protein CbpA
VALGKPAGHFQDGDDGPGRDIFDDPRASIGRKFHPDRHMNSPQCAGVLQQLMGAFTKAHSVLSHEEKRASYDRKLAHSYLQTEEEQTTDNCFRLATKRRRDGNETGAIFWFRKCVNLAPEIAKYHASLATSLATLNHFRREAVEHFQKSYRARPVGPTGLFAARGALRNDATTVARRAVVFQSFGDGSGPRRSATEPRSDR